MEIITQTVLRRVCFVYSARISTIYNRHLSDTSVRMEKAVDELRENPYYEKYANKIANLQQTSPEEFLSKLNKHKKENKSTSTKERQFSSLLNPKEKLSANVEKVQHNLDQIMKIDLIKDKTAFEIQQIWEDYHKKKDVIAATIPAKEFNVICEQAKSYPIFIFPLPRSQGYEFIMSEFRNNDIHFTPLICYQVHKENAPECLTIKHYTEFMDEKGIVLMRGEFDKNVIDSKEAQCLANQLQLYYSRKYADKTQLLELFTQKPNEFKHVDLIKQIESLSLG